MRTWKLSAAVFAVFILAGMAKALEPVCSSLRNDCSENNKGHSSTQATGGRIVRTWKLSAAVFAVFILAGMAKALEPVATTGPGALSPCTTAICTGVCYCPKTLPCPPCMPCDGICVCYCPKTLPCPPCMPCDGICVPYCCKPLPCLCLPIARPQCCNSPSCVGVGRY